MTWLMFWNIVAVLLGNAVYLFWASRETKKDRLVDVWKFAKKHQNQMALVVIGDAIYVISYFYDGLDQLLALIGMVAGGAQNPVTGFLYGMVGQFALNRYIMGRKEGDDGISEKHQ